MSSNDRLVKEMFREGGALWSFDYSGNPKAPHAEWTGGRCADGYTNSRLILSDPRSTKILAEMIVKKYKTNFRKMPDWVVGSPYAAITFSYEVARQMYARHGFVKKSVQDPKAFVWDELKIPRGATILQCEELISTMETALRVRKAVEAGNGNTVIFLPQVLTIFHYPNIQTSKKPGVVSLAERTDIKTWTQDNCPLCAQGSPRLRPAQHWEELTQRR